MTTALDLDVLLGLDFAATLPCEHGRHAARHADEPARWVVITGCGHCQRGGHYLLCESGRQRMRWPATLGCVWCGAMGHWDDFVVSCLPIPESRAA